MVDSGPAARGYCSKVRALELAALVRELAASMLISLAVEVPRCGRVCMPWALASSMWSLISIISSEFLMHPDGAGHAHDRPPHLPRPRRA